MSGSDSPFQITTRVRGWNLAFAIGAVCSFILNIIFGIGFIRLSSNLSTPRIVYKAPSGVILPLSAGSLVWTPELAQDFIQRTLPILFTYWPASPPDFEGWAPFINSTLLKSSRDSYLKKEGQIRSDGLNQTLKVLKVDYNPDNDTALVQSELRIIDRNGQLTKKPLSITLELITTADPLNPYGHTIQSVH